MLVFETELLKKLGSFQGFTLEVDKYLPTILEPSNNSFMERATAEKNVNFKQLISYVVLRHKNTFFSYTRGMKANEKRLIGKRSIALGGHIEHMDNPYVHFDKALYLRAAQREVNEEVLLGTNYVENIVALINDDSNPVGRVHFGILHIWDIEHPKVSSRESTIADPCFVSSDKLMASFNELETWSQIALKALEK